MFRTNASDDAALHIRRVIGLPGETVQIRDGVIYIDGEVYERRQTIRKFRTRGWRRMA